MIGNKPPVDSEEKKKHIMQVLDVRFAIEKLKEDSGKIECPRCGGTISFVKAGPKKHIHANCSTEKCINFME